jgi:ParB family chromosome partitioning protein
MHLEFHQLDRQWEHLRVREPHRQRRLLASLAESGQQTPIVVVVSKDNGERYLVIDGYKRIAALEQLKRDTVEATVWPMSEAEALVLSRSLRFSPQEAHSNRVGCCRRWSTALATLSTNWRTASIVV